MFILLFSFGQKGGIWYMIWRIQAIIQNFPNIRKIKDILISDGSCYKIINRLWRASYTFV